jgi:Protein of unknown function (DUF3105)
MADKPRVKAPQKRHTTKSDDVDRRRLLIVVGSAVTLLVVVGLAFLLIGASGGSSTSPEDAKAALQTAGCTFTVKPAVPNAPDHSDFPNPAARSDKWNTDPPTSGPHYGVTLIYGAYTEPIEIGRVVHNLEHGAIFILYGDEVSAATVAQLKTFYDSHENGTILAPYPRLGDKIALGAWNADGLPEASSARGSGILAECTKFDQAAFDAFFSAFQFKGPESFAIGPSQMKPGDN